MSVMLKRIKYFASEKILSNPYTLYFAWLIIPRLTFLLPHDRAFLGFRYFLNNPNKLFFDIGANNGISAASFRRIAPDWQILSIEANELHVPALENLARRIDGFRYKILGAANQHSTLKLFTPFYRWMALHANTSSSKEYAESALRRILPSKSFKHITYVETEVNVVPLDELNVVPGIIKIDTEGHDLAVLMGLRKTIEAHRPAIMFEFNPEMGEGIGTFMQSVGYDLYLYDFKTDRFGVFDYKVAAMNWHEDKLNINPFAIPTESNVSFPKA